MLSRFVPLLATTICIRTRGHFMSPGLWLAAWPGTIVAAVLVLYATAMIPPGEDFAWVREFVGILLVFVEFSVMLWLPVAVGLHCGKERDRGQWLVFRDSSFGAHQLLASVIIGSVLPEWSVALVAVILEFWFDAIPWFVHAWLWLWVLGAALVVVHFQVRRFGSLIAPQLALLGKLVALVFLGFFVFPSAATQLATYCPVPSIDGNGIMLVLMTMAVTLLWVRCAAILSGKTLSTWVLLIRLSSAPAISGLLFLLPRHDSAVGMLPAAFGALFSLVVTDALSTLWEQGTSQRSHWSPRTIRVAFLATLALASAIWFAGEVVHETLPNQILIATHVLLGAVGRLVCYFLWQSWLQRRGFRWQPGILAFALVMLEIVLPVGLDYGGWLAYHHSSPAVALHEYLLLGGLAACSSLGQMVSLQSLRGHEGLWNFPWVELLSPLFGILLLSLLLAALDRLLRYQQARRPKVDLPQAESLGPIGLRPSRSAFPKLLAATSPLLVALARRSRRRLLVLRSPIQVLAFLSALFAIIAFVLSLYRGGGVLTIDLIRGYGLWLIWSQSLLLVMALVATFTTLRLDRKAGILDQHLASSLSAWQIALGYLFGPSSAPLRLAAVATTALLVLGWVSGRTLAMIHQQLSMLLLFVILNAVLARTEAGRFVLWSTDGAVRSPPRWRLFGVFVLMITVTVHVFIAGMIPVAAAMSESDVRMLGRVGTELGHAVKQMSPHTASAFQEALELTELGSILVTGTALSASLLLGVSAIAHRFRIGASPNTGVRSLLIPALILLAALPNAMNPSQPGGCLAMLGLVGVSVFGHSASSGYGRMTSRAVSEESLTIVRQDLSLVGVLLAVMLIGTVATLGHSELRERIPDWGASVVCGSLVVLARLIFYLVLFRYLSVACERWRFVVSTVCYFGLEFFSIVICSSAMLAISTTHSFRGLFSAVAQALSEIYNLSSADGTGLSDTTSSELATRHLVSVINISLSLAAAALIRMLTIRRARRTRLFPADAPQKERPREE